MPKTVAEVLAHADYLASEFENQALHPGSAISGQALVDLRVAVMARARAERAVVSAVADARRDGHSWASIGAMMGTSGEAARQRYSPALKLDRPPNQSGLTKEFEAAIEILIDAGFTMDELREFRDVLQFAWVLAEAGHDGPVANIDWTQPKSEAMIKFLTALGAKRGRAPGPSIHLGSLEETLPFPVDSTNDGEPHRLGRC